MLGENEWLKGYRIATISFAGKKTGKCLCVFMRNFQGQGRQATVLLATKYRLQTMDTRWLNP